MKRSLPAIRNPEDIGFVGKQVRNRRQDLGWTTKKLQAMFNKRLGKGKTGEDRLYKLEHTRIEGAREKKNDTVAILEPEELQVLAELLEVGVDWLLPPHLRPAVVCLLPLGSPEFARVVGHRLGEELKDAKELLGWASYLPCSLETPEFMRAHNESILRRQPTPLPAEIAADIEAAIEAYNKIGAGQQENFISSLGKRKWDFVHMIFWDDLKRISLGQDEYQSISRDVRKAEFRHLIELLSDPANRVTLLIANEKDIPKDDLYALKGDDSRVAVDGKFLFKRDRQGKLMVTDNEHEVLGYRLLLDRLRASVQEPQAVIPLLEKLAQDCRN